MGFRVQSDDFSQEDEHTSVLDADMLIMWASYPGVYTRYLIYGLLLLSVMFKPIITPHFPFWLPDASVSVLETAKDEQMMNK